MQNLDELLARLRRGSEETPSDQCSSDERTTTFEHEYIQSPLQRLKALEYALRQHCSEYESNGFSEETSRCTSPRYTLPQPQPATFGATTTTAMMGNTWEWQEINASLVQRGIPSILSSAGNRKVPDGSIILAMKTLLSDVERAETESQRLRSSFASTRQELIREETSNQTLQKQLQKELNHWKRVSGDSQGALIKSEEETVKVKQAAAAAREEIRRLKSLLSKLELELRAKNHKLEQLEQQAEAYAARDNARRGRAQAAYKKIRQAFQASQLQAQSRSASERHIATAASGLKPVDIVAIYEGQLDVAEQEIYTAKAEVRILREQLHDVRMELKVVQDGSTINTAANTVNVDQDSSTLNPKATAREMAASRAAALEAEKEVERLRHELDKRPSVEHHNQALKQVEILTRRLMHLSREQPPWRHVAKKK